jgi:ribonuclease P protein component
VVVPKKVAKLAVWRNNHKRRVVAIVRDVYKTIVPSVDGLVFVNRDLTSLSASELREELTQAFKKAQILYN